MRLLLMILGAVGMLLSLALMVASLPLVLLFYVIRIAWGMAEPTQWDDRIDNLLDI